MHYDDIYQIESNEAPDVECKRCGKKHKMLEVVRINTWNLGHYHCKTIYDCPRTHLGWHDPGCKECEAELNRLKSKACEEIESRFWKS